ncbi:dehydroquinate dehydratase, putative / shikimate dehydrogenase [Artemisia annua]|uniref:Dehydroquinate dehydratase, putative / shikimate dehydrogenase n=1 Tax=Artemisia annua TaxID=35608 RepID=A0A2U1NQM0_ARTAN|nr:dehydroquinate dehydratase, putative / shikimate dehydrogenase [Artemisia annua]
MQPNIDDTPISKEALKLYAFVFDVVCRPKITRLLREEGECGAIYRDGDVSCPYLIETRQAEPKSEKNENTGTQTKRLLPFSSEELILKTVLQKVEDAFQLVGVSTVKTAIRVFSQIEVSKDGKQFAVTSSDRRIRIFWCRTGGLLMALF